MLDNADYAKYPFLDGAKSAIESGDYALDFVLKRKKGKILAAAASRRIINSISFKKEHFDEIKISSEPKDDILKYALARIIVSCIGDKRLFDRLVRYESERASTFLKLELPDNKFAIAGELGIDLRSETMSVINYIELVSSLRDQKWRLVNRDVHNGKVMLEREEFDSLLKEKIRLTIKNQPLPKVPDHLCEMFKPLIDEINSTYQEKILEQFGSIEESAFPPCMQAIIGAVTAGTNIPHTARFALTAFLHTIGMDMTQIVEVYTRAPDFDVSRTMYQVEHISGRGGTEYTPPGCSTMRTYGLCVNRDRKICDKINHPLSYYKEKKRQIKKSGEKKD